MHEEERERSLEGKAMKNQEEIYYPPPPPSGRKVTEEKTAIGETQGPQQGARSQFEKEVGP